MKYEILSAKDYDELDGFLENHKNAQIYQAPIWRNMRPGQPFEIIAVRDEQGKIKGSMTVFVSNKYGKNMLFCPRGPVFDDDDIRTFEELYLGALSLQKKYHAYCLRMDPLILKTNAAFEKSVRKLAGKILFVDDREIDTSPSHVVYLLPLKDRTIEEIFESFDSHYRYKIRRSERRGIELKVGKKEDLPAFHALLTETSNRKKFNGRPLPYFERLFQTLNDKNYHLLMAYYEGKLIAAAFLLCYGKTAIYLYGASSESNREVMPNHLIQWSMIKWAKEHGFDTYSFGGIPGYKDEKNPAYGIYRFKRGFNGIVEEYIGEINFIYKPFIYQTREKLLPFLRKIKG